MTRLAAPPGPTRPLRGRAEDRLEALVGQVPQPELERVDPEPVGELVQVRFACEVIRRRGQRPVGTLREGGITRLKVDALVRDVVGREDGRRTGIVGGGRTR